MSADNIEKLYKHFGVLADAKEKIGEHETEYMDILNAIKGSTKEKRLASQFIARFFKHFPALADQAFEALLDLCEDEDVSIRKQAIKDLPGLCKDNKEHTHKTADILAQLLQAEDNTELGVAHNSLMTLFKIDAKGTLSGIFSQILNGEDIVRERCLKFLTVKLKALGHDVINKEAEDFLIAECKKVLQDVTADEFHNIMDILGWSRLGHTVAGQQELVSLVAEQAGLSLDFNPKSADNENVERLVQCVKHALPYFSDKVDSGKFVSYMCEQVLPQLSEIASTEGGGEHLEILKLFAELCAHCTSPLENVESKVQKILDRLIEYMPLPPEGEENTQEHPRLEFSYVECLIFSLHRIARLCPDYLSKDPEKLKDFRFRLQYFSRGTQGYIKKLREALQGKSQEEMKTDENKIKVVALKTTSNIHTLIKDLFHTPPSYKSVISLSWKPSTSASSSQKNGSSSGLKRHTPISFPGGGQPNKQSKPSSEKAREIYTPPGGKYSNKVSSYMLSSSSQRGRGNRGRGRGGSFRGNRTWRRNY